MSRPSLPRLTALLALVALVAPAAMAQQAGIRPRDPGLKRHASLLKPVTPASDALLVPQAGKSPPPGGCACHSCEHTDCSCGCAESFDGAHDLPPGFYDQVMLEDLDQATGFVFVPGGLIYVWEKGGVIRVVEADGSVNATPLLDLAEEVGNWGDHGLLSAALDPQFESNGWVYLLYVVDHHHAKWFGTPQYDPEASDPDVDTIGRVTRYTANASDGFRTVVPASQLVLLGESITTGIPIMGTTHGVGSLQFGDDGTLLVSAGDGTGGAGSGTGLADGIILPKEDVGSFRSQMVDSLSGKILRLDPATGDGVLGNPYYDALAPRAPRSRTFMLGLRQPCRFVLQHGTGRPLPGDANPGRLAIADVGAQAIEELSLAQEPGTNFGWPIHEGLEEQESYATSQMQNPDAPNPLFGAPGCSKPNFRFIDLLVEDTLLTPSWPNPCNPALQITNVPTWVHHRPALDWLHEGGLARVPTYDAGGAASFVTLGDPASPAVGEPFGGNCSIAGAWYDGDSFPAEYDDTLFHCDFGAGWIRNFVIDAAGQLQEARPFANLAGKPVWVEVNPDDGSLWYLDYTTSGEGRLRAIRFDPNNLPPLAVASGSPAFGPAPLQAVFEATGSSDPEGLPISLRWDFSDGTPYSIASHTARNLPEEDITDTGAFSIKVLLMDPPGSTGFSNEDPEVLRDGVRPPLSSLDYMLQYDTIHTVGGVSDKTGKDWLGYTFPATRTFTGMLFQEGQNYLGGGFFEQVSLQVRKNGVWSNVAGVTSDPPLPGNHAVSWETFEIRFPPVDGTGLRLYGFPGGISTLDFVTVAELRVMARPVVQDDDPWAFEATLLVTDAAGAEDTATVGVALNDTPPAVTIFKPHTGVVFSTSGATPVDCHSEIKDAESLDGELEITWQVILHHDNHTHPQPVVHTLDPTLSLIPEGDCNGDLFFQEIRCSAVDPTGLTATQSVYAVPDCDRNLNAQADTLDIANGTSHDVDANGVPDEVQSDCDGDGSADFYEIYFGTAVDEDGDGVPDDCGSLWISGKDKLPPISGPGPHY